MPVLSVLSVVREYKNVILHIRSRKERFENVYINDIRGEYVQRLYHGLVKEEHAVSSIKVVSVVLNGCFSQAMKNGLIARNPIDAATLPCQTERKSRQALTKEQQELFMEFAKESYLHNMFVIMLRTGMRSGEVRGLKYMDIDKKKREYFRFEIVLVRPCFESMDKSPSWLLPL